MQIRTIEEAEAALFQFIPSASQVSKFTAKDFTLERVKPLTTLAGDPQDKLKVIHIAGTSGKTSTAYYMAALLRTAGLKVGLTVSPHVDKVTERIQINGKPIAEDLFCSELAEFLKIVETVSRKPSYFELLYIFAYWVFARQKVDYAVIETGMGGLLDATNVAGRPDKVCIITDIGYDHMHILGNSLAEIAGQKAGIIHENNPTFMYRQKPEVMKAIQDWARRLNAPLTITTETQERSSYGGDLNRMPDYQQRNWLLAKVAYDFLINRDGLPRLSKTQLKLTQSIQIPARMEKRRLRGKTIVMDGAHNVQKMQAFISSFQHQYPKLKPPVLLSLKTGKEYMELAPLLKKLTSYIIVTTFETTQDLPVESMDPKLLAETLRQSGIEKVEVLPDQHRAFEVLMNCSEETVIITGSFYLLSQLRQREGLTI